MRNKRCIDTIALSIMGAFLIVFSALCFYKIWIGDVYVFVAAISEVTRNFPNLMHEGSHQPAAESVQLTPYLLSVSALGSATGVSPYNALQFVGVINVALFVASVAYFFFTFAGSLLALRASAIFLIVCTTLRGQNYFWSSELSLETIAFIQPYPSFVAWSSALLCFSVADIFLGTGRARYLIALVFMIWFNLLSHILTATWILTVVGAQFLARVLSYRAAIHSPFDPALRRVLFGCVAVTSAIPLAMLWPYSSPFSGMVTISEDPPFAGTLFSSFPYLYLLAAPAAFIGYRIVGKLTYFAVISFFATVLVYLVVRPVSDFFERYVFFASLFPQVVVSGVLASLSLRSSYKTLNGGISKFASGWALTSAVLLALSASTRSFTQLRFDLDARNRFELNYQALHRVVDERDTIAACPISNLTLDLFAATGARFILTTSSVKGITRASRLHDLSRLFSAEASSQEVEEILLSYGISKLLVGNECSVGKELQSRITAELAMTGPWRIYSLKVR